MNARKVCMTMMLLAGFIGLSTQSASAGTMAPSLAQEVKMQGDMALMRIKAENRYAATRSSKQALLALCEITDQDFRVVADRVKVQGQLAQWSIQESLLAGYRSGSQARLALGGYVTDGAVNVASADSKPALGKARDILKSTRLDMPEFLPAIFR